MIDLFLNRHSDGHFDAYDSRDIKTFERSSKEYRDLFYELLNEKKLLKNYADGIIRAIKQE